MLAGHAAYRDLHSVPWNRDVRFRATVRRTGLLSRSELIRPNLI